MDTWATLFDRAEAFDVDAAAVEQVLRERRADESGAAEPGATDESGAAESAVEPTTDRPEPSPARVVADADVLAADLLVGGDARAALDHLREHSWTTLVASDALLDDAEAVVATLAAPPLAGDWRERVEAWRERVVHPADDHPAIASAYRGGAMHVLSLDDRLTAAAAGVGLTDRFPVSVREPRAFVSLFDAAKLYPAVADGEYPGPDRDPRA